MLNWNGREHLEECLESLSKQSFRDFEVVFLDNGSSDGSVSFVAKNYPWVKIVRLDENIGFASGNNRALEKARGDYLVTLNNDTRAELNWLEKLVQVADAHPEAGMIGCRICSYHDPDIVDSVGMALCVDGMSRGRFRNRRWSNLNLAKVEEIFFPSACAALYKRAMIDETGFFDDEFFAYAEDSDLGLRGRLYGWRAVAATDAIIYHKYSMTSGYLSPFKVSLVERNHFWVVLKNFPPFFLLLYPFSTILRYFEQARCVLSGKGTGGVFRAESSRLQIIRSFLTGLGKGLAGAPRMFAKRKEMLKRKRLSWREFSFLMRRYRLSFKELLER